jgi:hypothetical protein
MVDTTSWHDIIESAGTIVAIITACFAYWRASKQKHNDQLSKIQDQLTEHILQDEHSITELQADVRNLNNDIGGKLDNILRELDK